MDLLLVGYIFMLYNKMNSNSARPMKAMGELQLNLTTIFLMSYYPRIFYRNLNFKDNTKNNKIMDIPK